MTGDEPIVDLQNNRVGDGQSLQCNGRKKNTFYLLRWAMDWFLPAEEKNLGAVRRATEVLWGTSPIATSSVPHSLLEKGDFG